MLDIRICFEYASGAMTYFDQKLYLKSLIGLFICLCLYLAIIKWIQQSMLLRNFKNGKKQVPFVSLFKHFRFWIANYQLGGLQHDSNFMNHCIYRQSKIALPYYFFVLLLQFMADTNTSGLIQNDFHKLIINWEVHNSLLTCNLATFFLQ